MRLAIVHYHLRKGGVTRVIASALEALGEGIGQVVVLSSTEPEESLPCPVAVIPELAYCTGASREAAGRLHKAMRAAARRHLGAEPDLWHIHNHSLGKNVNFPEAMRHLVEAGERLLLQIHDFAEDGRPGNYRAQRQPYEAGIFGGFDTALYPVAPRIGYAVLNGRDRDILLGAGIPGDRVHWLPNAVAVPQRHSTGGVPAFDRPLILYPTRAIRRKNLGELLLMAAVCPDFHYATSLSPENPEWAAFHEIWVGLAGELGLPVSFGLGESGHAFADLVTSAEALVTTSVGEGFGLAFLEPWLFGKAVIGRDLPEITGDFRDNGIELPGLYAEWPVPCDLFDLAGQRGRFLETAGALYAGYGKAVSRDQLARAWDAFIRGGRIDFGRLDETAQAEVVRAVAADRRRLGIPVNLNPADAALVSANAERIQSAYGISHYGEMLSGIYRKLMDAPAGEAVGIGAERVLDAFLDPARLRLLRT